VALSREQIESFRRDGHVLLRDVADGAYMSGFRAAVADAVARFKTETKPLDERDTYGRAFIQVTNLWRKYEAVRSFVLEPLFGRLAAELLGVEHVRLYHDQALVKEPLGGRTPWHQDRYYWPLATDDTVTVWMPLVDIDEGMGSMSFASGSHRGVIPEDIAISDESDALYERHVREREYPVYESGAMRAGDCTFHYGRTIHRAGPNLSETRAREVMTMIYFADGTLVAEPAHVDQNADLEAFLGGRRPGEAADSEMNPLVV
jgi:ectoine hydroxylase-related dioxygenase (phytanoyl-CoA dioxygenase family)